MQLKWYPLTSEKRRGTRSENGTYSLKLTLFTRISNAKNVLNPSFVHPLGRHMPGGTQVLAPLCLPLVTPLQLVFAYTAGDLAIKQIITEKERF